MEHSRTGYSETYFFALTETAKNNNYYVSYLPQSNKVGNIYFPLETDLASISEQDTKLVLHSPSFFV